MCDGNLEDLALLRGIRERRVRLLDANVDVAADETQAAVAHHCAGNQTRLAKNLEAVADAQDHTAGLGEFIDGLHPRRNSRVGARHKLVSMGAYVDQTVDVTVYELVES